MSDELRQVNLKVGYWFTCEDCDQDNFIIPEPITLADVGFDGREEAYRHLNGLDDWAELPVDWDQFEVSSMPTTVKCSECGSEFKAADSRDEDGDELI